jgi:hypothetical protein
VCRAVGANCRQVGRADRVRAHNHQAPPPGPAGKGGMRVTRSCGAGPCGREAGHDGRRAGRPRPDPHLTSTNDPNRRAPPPGGASLFTLGGSPTCPRPRRYPMGSTIERPPATALPFAAPTPSARRRAAGIVGALDATRGNARAAPVVGRLSPRAVPLPAWAAGAERPADDGSVWPGSRRSTPSARASPWPSPRPARRPARPPGRPGQADGSPRRRRALLHRRRGAGLELALAEAGAGPGAATPAEPRPRPGRRPLGVGAAAPDGHRPRQRRAAMARPGRGHRLPGGCRPGARRASHGRRSRDQA